MIEVFKGFGYDELQYWKNTLMHAAILKILAEAGVEKAKLPKVAGFYEDFYSWIDVVYDILCLAGAVFDNPHPDRFPDKVIEEDAGENAHTGLEENYEDDGFYYAWLPLGGRNPEEVKDLLSSTLGESLWEIHVEGDYLRLDFYLELPPPCPYNAAVFYAEYTKIARGDNSADAA